MKAYQIILQNGQSHTLPFHDKRHAEKYCQQKGFKDYVIQDVVISPGEYYRNMNVIYMKDTVFLGVVKGVYYNDYDERLLD